MLHRDADFMTAEEVQKWRQSFKTQGVFPWVTAVSDIESYFCEAPYLAALYGISDQQAEQWRTDAAQKVGKARDTFLEKRKNVTRILWPHGGSPNAEEMWEQSGGKTPATVKGKKLLAALKVIAKAAGKDDRLLDNFTIPVGLCVAEDLKSVIENAVAASATAAC